MSSVLTLSAYAYQEALPLVQAMAIGTPPAKADVRRVYALVDNHVREARGMPPRLIRLYPGKARGQSLALEGKPEPA